MGMGDTPQVPSHRPPCPGPGQPVLVTLGERSKVFRKEALGLGQGLGAGERWGTEHRNSYVGMCSDTQTHSQAFTDVSCGLSFVLFARNAGPAMCPMRHRRDRWVTVWGRGGGLGGRKGVLKGEMAVARWAGSGTAAEWRKHSPSWR